MNLGQAGAAFISGLAQSSLGKESYASRAEERMEYERSPEGIRANEYTLRREIENNLARQAGENEGNKKVYIQDILGHGAITGDETLNSDLATYLPEQSYLQVKSFYDRVNNPAFSGFLHVKREQDFGNSEAVKFGNMSKIFETPTGAYYSHNPNGQEVKVQGAVKDLAVRIHEAKNKLREERDMPEDKLNEEAYEIAFNSTSLDNQTLFTQYNTTFTDSIDTLIKNMKSTFVTPDSFSSQINRVAVLQGVAKSGMSKDTRALEAAQTALYTQMYTKTAKRGMFTPQQYAIAMRKLFQPYMSKAAILGSKNQQAFMRGQLNTPKMEDKLFKILNRLYPKQNTPAKTDVPPPVEGVDTSKIQTFLGE